MRGTILMFHALTSLDSVCQDIPIKTDNRLIWIKDEKTGEYYAANRNYDNNPFDVFNTQVGMGYSKINSEYNGIKTSLKVFVPASGFIQPFISRIKDKTTASIENL